MNIKELTDVNRPRQHRHLKRKDFIQIFEAVKYSVSMGMKPSR